MTKRFGNFPENSSKKIRSATDDLWGDDLDDNDVNNVLLLATQAYEEKVISTQRQDISILPSYNTFKHTSEKRSFTSTQHNCDVNVNLQQPTSNVEAIPIKNQQLNGIIQKNGFKHTKSFDSSQYLDDVRMKDLQEKYIVKEGEISILRTQLKEVRKMNESEMIKKEKEWSEKLYVTKKELTAVKSELEFKNLEVANLKQKVIEVAKLSNLDVTFTSTQSPYFKQPSERCPVNKENVQQREDDAVVKTHQIQPFVSPYYPLQYVIPPSIFTCAKEEPYPIYIKNRHTCRNTIPFLQYQMSQELIESIIQLQPKPIMLDNKQLGFDCVHSDVSKMMWCTKQEINLVANISSISRILLVSEQLLLNTQQLLQKLEENYKNQDSTGTYMTYLESSFKDLKLDHSVYDCREWCEKEMSIHVRQSVIIIAEMLPFNDYIRDYLIHKKPLSFRNDDEILKYLPLISSKTGRQYTNNFDYMNLIYSIVTLVRKLKKTDYFPGLLSAVTILLSKICLYNNCETDLKPLIEGIAHEILFSHPSLQVLYHFVKFLKNIPNTFDASYFCKTSSRCSLRIDQKQKIVHYSDDVCLIQMFCLFLENRISEINNLKFFFNIIHFISNIMKLNDKKLYYMEDNYCDCVCRIVKLCVDVVCQTVKSFCKNRKLEQTDELELLRQTFKSGLRVLHILNVKAFDLIVKYILTHSYFKDTVMFLIHHKEVLDLNQPEVELLEDLNILAEMPKPDEDVFNSLVLWN